MINKYMKIFSIVNHQGKIKMTPFHPSKIDSCQVDQNKMEDADRPRVTLSHAGGSLS